MNFLVVRLVEYLSTFIYRVFSLLIKLAVDVVVIGEEKHSQLGSLSLSLSQCCIFSIGQRCLIGGQMTSFSKEYRSEAFPLTRVGYRARET